VYGKNRRIVLVGDAAHPPVPYVGQGAQMGVEDAGTLALLLKHLCVDEVGNLEFNYFADAMKIYERLRIPRTSAVLDCSKRLGALQDSRTSSQDAEMRELFIQGEVMMNETLPVMFPGATYNYQKDVMEAIVEEHEKQANQEVFNDLMLEGELLFNECETVMGFH
jgi:salicylate hydroxylase